MVIYSDAFGWHAKSGDTVVLGGFQSRDALIERLIDSFEGRVHDAADSEKWRIKGEFDKRSMTAQGTLERAAAQWAAATIANEF